MIFKALNPIIAGFAVAALAVALPVAQAQAHRVYDHHHYVNHHRPERRIYHVQHAVNQRVCIPMCPEDLLPCDPISFKIADGRCDQWY